MANANIANDTGIALCDQYANKFLLVKCIEMHHQQSIAGEIEIDDECTVVELATHNGVVCYRADMDSYNIYYDVNTFEVIYNEFEN